MAQGIALGAGCAGPGTPATPSETLRLEFAKIDRLTPATEIGGDRRLLNADIVGRATELRVGIDRNRGPGWRGSQLHDISPIAAVIGAAGHENFIASGRQVPETLADEGFGVRGIGIAEKPQAFRAQRVVVAKVDGAVTGGIAADIPAAIQAECRCKAGCLLFIRCHGDGEVGWLIQLNQTEVHEHAPAVVRGGHQVEACRRAARKCMFS